MNLWAGFAVTPILNTQIPICSMKAVICRFECSRIFPQVELHDGERGVRLWIQHRFNWSQGRSFPFWFWAMRAKVANTLVWAPCHWNMQKAYWDSDQTNNIKHLLSTLIHRCPVLLIDRNNFRMNLDWKIGGSGMLFNVPCWGGESFQLSPGNSTPSLFYQL